MIAVGIVTLALAVGLFIASRSDDDAPSTTDLGQVDTSTGDGATSATADPTVPTAPVETGGGLGGTLLPDAGATRSTISADMRATMVDGLEGGLGMTRPQAECTADKVLTALAAGELGEGAGLDAIVPYARECGFDGAPG
jgi:hypothetical protein